MFYHDGMEDHTITSPAPDIVLFLKGSDRENLVFCAPFGAVELAMKVVYA